MAGTDKKQGHRHQLSALTVREAGKHLGMQTA
jgi:hypothetical protein